MNVVLISPWKGVYGPSEKANPFSGYNIKRSLDGMKWNPGIGKNPKHRSENPGFRYTSSGLHGYNSTAI